jgi:hypothetical protein
MFKKFVVCSVLAVVAGGLFLTKTQAGSLVLAKFQRWWDRTEKKIATPEDQVAQLKIEIKKIDQAIKDEISELAGMEVKYEAEERSVKALRTRQAILESKMMLLETAIEQKKSDVTFEDKKTVTDSDFSKELVRLTGEFEAGKKTLATREQILKARKEALDARHAKIKAMKTAREELNVAVEELEAEIELMRLKQVEGRTGDDNAVGRCQELLEKARTRVRVMKKENELHAQYDDPKVNKTAVETKVSDQEALEQSRKARGVKPKTEAQTEGSAKTQ